MAVIFNNASVKMSPYLPGCYQAENATGSVTKQCLCGLSMQLKAAGSWKVTQKWFINILHTQSNNKQHTY